MTLTLSNRDPNNLSVQSYFVSVQYFKESIGRLIEGVGPEHLHPTFKYLLFPIHSLKSKSRLFVSIYKER